LSIIAQYLTVTVKSPIFIFIGAKGDPGSRGPPGEDGQNGEGGPQGPPGMPVSYNIVSLEGNSFGRKLQMMFLKYQLQK
jgi:hypothetical protein